MVMLCFFFSYVFVVPDDLTSSATDRTLAIASKIFAYTSRGLTPEAALGASKIILSETIASAICFTDGKQVLASWGEDSAKCPAGAPVVLKTTLSVIETGEQSVFSRDTSNETGGYFPRLRAGIVAPLTVRGHCVGTLELYYPRLSSIDMRQTAPCLGFCRPNFHAARPALSSSARTSLRPAWSCAPCNRRSTRIFYSIPLARSCRSFEPSPTRRDRC